MEIVDARGKMVNVGSRVRYNRTGTTGEVSAIKLEDDQGWIKMDDSELWYNTEYLEVMDKYQEKKIKAKTIDETTAAALEKSKKMKKDLEEVAMSSELCDGGG